MDYREILLSRFRERQRKNSAYSLRAFARDLGLDPSFFVAVLKGKKGLSKATALAVGRRLGLRSALLDHFCDLVESQHSRSQALKAAAIERIRHRQSLEIRDLTPETFHDVAEWHHFAIRELVGTEGFRDDPRWLARRLGISVENARNAWERLVRHGLVTRGAEGRWQSHEFVASPDGVPDASIQRFHSCMLQKSQRALATEPLSQRSSSSVVLAFDESQMARAKELIRDFRRLFAKDLKQSEVPKRRVYCITIQFFALDRIEDPDSTAEFIL